MAADLRPGTREVHHARFRSMGSESHVIVVDGWPSLLSVARRRLGQLEACWSRFIPTSEISTCNRLAGTPVWVSADTALLIDTAIEGWHLSAGRFDPTVLGDVLRAGYDLSFDELDGRPEWLRPAPPMLRRGCGEIAIERHPDGTAVVTMPDGIGFDPGGVGKGLAADLVVDALMAAGAAGACVNLGGDLAVRGVGPHGGGWTITVEGPSVDDPPVTDVGPRVRSRRHLDDRPATLDGRRRVAAPPDRSAHRRAVRVRRRAGHGPGRHRVGGRGAGQDVAAAGPHGRLRPARRPPSRRRWPSPTTAP